MSIVRDLPDALTDVRRPGDFYATGSFDWCAPAVSVAGVGPVAFPLLEDLAKRLIAVAQFAPYGRREETVVDASVRNSWQIDAASVEIAGARWAEALAKTVARAAEGLGVEGAVEAVFYKLLIYEPGGFFLDHRDTEKCPGMFATLIVAPPGAHEGGALIVRHREREARLDLKSGDPSEASFAAFYADCRHEVRPVESGYRLVLVYNLKKKGAAPMPPSYEAQAKSAAALLARWRASGEGPEKIVFPLEHAYTRAELSFAALKGADQAAAKTLLAAARESCCDLHLALLRIEESGEAEVSAYYGRRRWGGEAEFTAGEVYERDAKLSEWRNPADEACGLPSLAFQDEELSPPEALNELKPDEEEFSEATGNEGASFERAYSRAALVLWSRDKIFSILAGAEVGEAIGYLEACMAKAKSDDDRAGARRFAGEIAARLAEERWVPHRDGEPTPAARLLGAMSRLDDATSIASCIERVLPTRGFEPQDVETIFSALRQVEDDRRGPLLEKLMAGAAQKSFGACAKLMRRLGEAGDGSDYRPAASRLVAAIPQSAAEDPGWRPRRSSRSDELADLLCALRRIDERAAAQAVERLLVARETCSLDEVLVPALRRLAKEGELAGSGAAIERLRGAGLAHLRARTAEPLAPPADWRREAKLNCSCGDCAQFARFLADPEHKDYVLRAAQAARSHLETTIANSRCDVTTQTLRKGSPHSLVCIKNQASYERRVAQRKQDLSDIAGLGGAV